MNIETIDLNLLRVFDAIYREGNLSRAAHRLGMSQPGISQALNRLRETAGDPLFVRQTHGVTPTAYSDAIAGPIRQALNDPHAALQMQTASNLRQLDRSFRIAMSDYSESLILGPLLRAVNEQAPKLKLRVAPIDGIDLQSALNDGTVDLIVGAVPAIVDLYRHQELCTEELVCVARRGHPAIQGKLSVEQYEKARHVGIAVRGTTMSSIDQICKDFGFKRKVNLIVPNFLTIPFIVAASDNIGTMPRRLLRLIPPHLDLQVLAPPIEFPMPSIRQFWTERSHHDVASQWLREQMVKICRAL